MESYSDLHFGLLGTRRKAKAVFWEHLKLLIVENFKVWAWLESNSRVHIWLWIWKERNKAKQSVKFLVLRALSTLDETDSAIIYAQTHCVEPWGQNRYLSVDGRQRNSGVLNFPFCPEKSKTERSCIFLRLLIPKHKNLGTNEAYTVQ